MTTDTDPNHARMDEIAALQREVAELRRHVLHLQRAAVRQGRDHDELRQSLLKATGEINMALMEHSLQIIGARRGFERLAADAETSIANLHADNKRQDRALDHCYAWAEGLLRELDTWVQPLAERAWPKAYATIDEFRRIFPNGIGVVPNYLLPKRPSRNN
jgi:hypothetical protein